MKKNVSGQVVGAQMCSATDGSSFTGSVTVYVTGDGGTQAIGSVGSGVCTHEGNGFHSYAPSQAETNYDHVAFTFIGTGAVPSTLQVYPSFPQTGDAFGRLGAPAGASVSADVAAAKVDTAAIKVKTDFLPSATAGAAGGLFIAGANAATSITTALTANITGNLSGSVGSVTGAVGSVTGNVGGNVTGSIGSVATGGITAGSIAADAIGASELAADAVTEISAGVWAAATRELTAGTNIVLAKGVGVTGFNDLSAAAVNAEVDTAISDAALATAANLATVAGYIDTEVAAIKAKTDNLPASPAATSDIPTAAAVADAVWDEAISGHLTAGSTGAALNAAGSAGDPWTTPLPGAYGAGTAGLIVATILGVTDKLGTTLTPATGSPGEYQFTSDALELAPAGGGGGGSAPSAAAVAAAVWSEALPGAYGAGAAGQILGDNLNATVGSRATQASVDAVDTVVDAILLDTAEIGVAGAGLTVLATAANLAAVAGYIDTEVAAIKAKTDNLPASPAATSDIPSAAAVADAVWDEALSGHVSAGAAGLALRDADLRGSRTVVRGTVGTGTTPSTTQFTPSALSPSGAAADQFKGRIIVFDNDTTTTALRGQATDITASTGAALPLLTFTALTTAPSSGDTFSVL